MAEDRYEEAETSALALERDKPAWIEAHRILAFKYFEARQMDRSAEVMSRVLGASANLP